MELVLLLHFMMQVLLQKAPLLAYQRHFAPNLVACPIPNIEFMRILLGFHGKISQPRVQMLLLLVFLVHQLVVVVNFVSYLKPLVFQLESLITKDAREAEIQGVIAEVPEMILKCVSRDEADLVVAQKVIDFNKCSSDSLS
ncbi:hypothetical protein MRB53_027284 [Persea americana]|uniref:Uncharacterized protein n=1 Tax=Persea americana TaxID=3435 RepID=A0ACC2LL67_PERAE|nr:hypothetical protein MRB53_027284 [Persea americana]